MTPVVFYCPSSGVPLSTQWGPQGYFYAIQIAQYGLSHYSKNLTERPPHVEVYDTAEERDSRPSAWTVPKGCSLGKVYDKTRGSSVRQFSAPGGTVCHTALPPLPELYMPYYTILLCADLRALITFTSDNNEADVPEFSVF